MDDIPNDTVDMVLCDLPYGTTEAKWDSVIPFNLLWAQYNRIAKPNAQETAQIELIEAQRKQTEITTILNLASTIDDETKLQLICEQLSIDYQQIKDKVPQSEDDPTAAAQAVLDGIQAV